MNSLTPKRSHGRLSRRACHGWLFVPLFALCAGTLPTFAWDDRPCVSEDKVFQAPHAILRGGRIAAVIMHPDPDRGFYRKQRFVHAGIVSRLVTAGHSYIGGDPGNSLDPLAGAHSMGISGEFGEPLIVRTATPGTPVELIRIGLGSFTAASRKPKDLRAAQWDEKATWEWRDSNSSVSYSQEFDHESGYGYRLEKIVSMVPEKNILRLDYELENTGDKRIETSHYLHNWFRPDGATVSRETEVLYPFRPATAVVSAQLKNGASFEGNRLTFSPNAENATGATFIEFEARPNTADNQSVLRNRDTGARVAIRGDWAPVTHKLYATTRGVCPEPFIDIFLRPGATVTWSVNYDFL